MIIFKELTQFISIYKYIFHQISDYGSNLEFETWIYSDKIKINDEFSLHTPDIYFEVVRYNIPLNATKYKFNIYTGPMFIKCITHRKLFDYLFTPAIFKVCEKKYKEMGKQK